MTEFLQEVLLDGLIDTAKLLPFLFLTYLAMEFIEHRAAAKAERLLLRVGRFGPLLGGLFGAVPQCGFSVAAANLYAGHLLTAGTLVAVFLSTSDEMLPLLLSGGVRWQTILLLIGGKAAVGILVGFLFDLLFRRRGKEDRDLHIDELCDKDGCHCERGILRSALHHTLHITVFLLLVTLAINTLVFFIGAERLSAVMSSLPGVSHTIAALFGLIPNCAASVALTQFWMDGIITAGTMLAGLLPGAGLGLLVLFRVNPRLRENLLILAVLVACGVGFGVLADVTGFSALLS